MIFEKDEDGRTRPIKEMVDHMLWCSQTIAMENVELSIQRSMENYQRNQQEQREKPQLQNGDFIQKQGNLKISHAKKMVYHDPETLEQKRNKLRLYIAHMQGYDRDRDRDGGRGIDMTTGVVIDFGDIYIADKSNGAIIEDIDRDGIDIRDIH